ncbi:flagellar hook capping FlgD N-terminal domain-containing protein [Clostridium sp. MD294]|uniref:flagellar hook assembly protein FlgD n=1 Tax=Clostridium sp. MD294 TaxID=97138 RepID=UPI0003A40C53|nr:flagellar hook capping FlgD N-terminal domain-containing protein [Clostridium sp. MD294]
MAIDNISAAYNQRAEDAFRKAGTYSKTTLDSTDFLKLIAAQLQNQDMTNPMSNSEMMQQLSQMSSIQTMSELKSAIENMNDIAVTNYSASLVGKEVTLAVENSKGELETKVGLITGTGLYQGETVVFVDGKAYSLSQIMAVGKIPEEFIENEGNDKNEGVDGDVDKDEGIDKDESIDKDDTTDNTEEVKPEA